MSAADLYEDDFYLWTQGQAAALRAHGRGGNALDYERLAEEVEDLGKSDYRESRSYVLRILEHLYKLAWSQRAEPRGGWRAEIVTFRVALEDALTPTIRRKIEEDGLERLHEVAAKAAGLAFDTMEPEAQRDPALRWTMAQILGEADDPIA
jgi:hypothetical protein